MSLTAQQFSESLGGMAAEVDSAIVNTKRAVALEVLRGVVLGNPVGQPALWSRPAPKGYVGGYSRGNWQMTSGAPAETEVPLRSPESVFLDAEGVDVDVEEHVWITNNAPYIRRLEYGGHSSQAPEGWVRAVIERARARYGG